MYDIMHKTQNLLAAFVIVALLSAVGAYLLAHQRAASLHGPVHIRAGEHEVVAADSRNLSWLDAGSGKLLRQRTLSEMGLSTPLMDMQRLPDGSLLAAETDTKQLRHCTPDADRCTLLADLSWLAGRFFKFHYDAAEPRLFVAGTHSNRIWELQPPFGQEEAHDLAAEVLSPNEIWLSPEGSLWVADTDRHRVIELWIKESEARETGRMLPGETDLLRKSFPLDFAGTGAGPWWSLLTGQTYLNGEIVEYDKDGQPKRLVELPSGADPITVEPLGNEVVIADMANFALYRVDANGQLARFGDKSFYATLDAIESERDRFVTMKYIALAVIIAAIAAAVFIAVWSSATRNASRASPGKMDEIPNDASAYPIHWMEPDPGLIRRMQRLATIPLFIAALTMLSVYATGHWFFDHSQFHLLVTGILAAIGGVLWLRAKGVYPVLGTDGRYIYVREWLQGIQSHSPQEARLTSTALWLGRRRVALVNVYDTPIYNPDAVDRLIRPLLDSTSP